MESSADGSPLTCTLQIQRRGRDVKLQAATLQRVAAMQPLLAVPRQAPPLRRKGA